MNSQELFKSDGDRKVIQQLVSLYNQGIRVLKIVSILCCSSSVSLLIQFCYLCDADLNASLPEGVNPIDVAGLMKCYLASLPEPLTTFELYNEIRGARSNIHVMRNVLKRLPTVNYMTLELITALLLRVSQKSLLNKAGCISFLAFTYTSG